MVPGFFEPILFQPCSTPWAGSRHRSLGFDSHNASMLFHVGLVVFVARPGRGEGGLLSMALLRQVVVDELGPFSPRTIAPSVINIGKRPVITLNEQSKRPEPRQVPAESRQRNYY